MSSAPQTASISASQWKQLYRSLLNQECILILGPELATINDGKSTLLRGFATKLTNELEESNVPFDDNFKDDLPYIGLRWLKGIPGMDAGDLHDEFRDFCFDYVDDLPKIYKELANLPFFLVINTAPDDYMQQAFQRANKKPSLMYYNYMENRTSSVPEMSAEKPIVYNLFGYYDQSESLVITKEDQVRFMNNLLGNVSALPNEILRHFKGKTYLFLGFDINTWHLPLLFHCLRLQETKSAFYLNDQPKTAKAIFDFYKDSYNFTFADSVAAREDFVHQLQTGYEDFKENRDTPTLSESVPYIDRPQAGLNGKSSVLIMTSMPKDASALELNEEINLIEAAHNSATKRDMFAVKPILDIRKRKLLEILLRQKPQILHFSGHGSGSDGLLFYNNEGYSDLVQGEELAMLFRQFNDVLNCVVLNACYSEAQAQTIAKYIPNVIGTNSAIGDELARVFSEGFYMALFSGETYEKAFNMAMAHVGMQKFPQGGRPVFYKNGEKV